MGASLGPTEDAKDELIERNGWALGWVAIALGCVIVWCHLESGPRRWSAAVWQTALTVPGSPATWGVLMALAGVLMLYGIARDSSLKRTDARVTFHEGCRIAFLWCCCIDGVQVYALLDDATGIANPLGPILWTYFAWIYRSRFKLSHPKSQGGEADSLWTFLHRLRRTT